MQKLTRKEISKLVREYHSYHGDQGVHYRRVIRGFPAGNMTKRVSSLLRPSASIIWSISIITMAFRIDDAV